MAAVPQFAATALIGAVGLSAANTARDGSGTCPTVCTAPSSGARIDVINIKATGTTTAGMVRIFHHDGSTTRLITEVAVSAIVPSATVATFEAAIYFPEGFILSSGHLIKAAPHNAETFNVFARGGSF